MPDTKKHPVIKPKSSMRQFKRFRNRKPDDEGKVLGGKARGKRSGK